MVILLSTNWSNTFFHNNGRAPYYGNPNLFRFWDNFANNCPFPAIGFYRDHITGRANSATNYVYINVNGIEHDDRTLYFSYEYLLNSNTRSIDLMNSLPLNNRNLLFTSIDENDLYEIFNRLNETPPNIWVNFNNQQINEIPRNGVELIQPTIEFNGFIGNYFTEIIHENLANNEFEDRVKSLLTALGFDVIQRGHIVQGRFPDGYAQFDNNILVYDCKNSNNYFPIAEDSNALDGYLNQARNLYPGNNLFSAFIAKSYSNNLPPNYIYFSIDSLNYLLYKKLILGNGFNLLPLLNILSQGQILTRILIDINWFPMIN